MAGPGSEPSTNPDAAPSLNGRRFAAVAVEGPGDVDAQTVFEYHEEHGVVWAEYVGGDVVRGYLVGRRVGDVLSFRYVHLAADGSSSSGHCHTEVLVSADGSLELHESWEWDSKSGSGTSILGEVG